MRVAAAALRLEDGTIVTEPPPARHHDLIKVAVAEHGARAGLINEQGFVDEDGRFMRRKPAGQAAIEAGQIEKLRWPPNLYSEDLW